VDIKNALKTENVEFFFSVALECHLVLSPWVRIACEWGALL